MTAFEIIGIVLLIAGFVLVGIEMAVPGFGLPGISGIISLVLGIVFTADSVSEGIIMAIIVIVIWALCCLIPVHCIKNGCRIFLIVRTRKRVLCITLRLVLLVAAVDRAVGVLPSSPFLMHIIALMEIKQFWRNFTPKCASM